jgi:hypothetical protein
VADQCRRMEVEYQALLTDIERRQRQLTGMESEIAKTDVGMGMESLPGWLNTLSEEARAGNLIVVSSGEEQEKPSEGEAKVILHLKIQGGREAVWDFLLDHLNPPGIGEVRKFSLKNLGTAGVQAKIGWETQALPKFSLENKKKESSLKLSSSSGAGPFNHKLWYQWAAPLRVQTLTDLSLSPHDLSIPLRKAEVSDCRARVERLGGPKEQYELLRKRIEFLSRLLDRKEKPRLAWEKVRAAVEKIVREEEAKGGRLLSFSLRGPREFELLISRGPDSPAKDFTAELALTPEELQGRPAESGKKEGKTSKPGKTGVAGKKIAIAVHFRSGGEEVPEVKEAVGPAPSPLIYLGEEDGRRQWRIRPQAGATPP